jgi:protein involved in polysaccharide export with SLBB domain
MKTGIVMLLAALAWSYSQAADDARVFVIGAINHPGSFRYEQGLTVETLVVRVGMFPLILQQPSSGFARRQRSRTRKPWCN